MKFFFLVVMLSSLSSFASEGLSLSSLPAGTTLTLKKDLLIPANYLVAELGSKLVTEAFENELSSFSSCSITMDEAKKNNRVMKKGSQFTVLSASFPDISYLYKISVKKDSGKEYVINCNRSATIEGSRYSAEGTTMTASQLAETIEENFEVVLSEPEVIE